MPQMPVEKSIEENTENRLSKNHPTLYRMIVQVLTCILIVLCILIMQCAKNTSQLLVSIKTTINEDTALEQVEYMAKQVKCFIEEYNN